MWLCLKTGSLDGFIPVRTSIPDDAITCKATWQGKPITLVYHPGLDHAVEHQIFKGTSDRKYGNPYRVNKYYGPRNRDDEDAQGADTQEMAVRYYIETEPEELEESFRFLSALTLRSLLTQQNPQVQRRLQREWEREKEIILTERGYYEDDTELVAREETQSRMFPKHPLWYSIDGTEEDIRSITLAQIALRYKTRYHPSNMLLIVIGGGVTPALIKKLSQKYFRSPHHRVLHIPSVIPNIIQSIPAKDRIKFIPKDRELLHICLGFPYTRPTTPTSEQLPASIRKHHSIAVLKKVLGGRWTSRTATELREKRGIGYRHHSFRSDYPGAGSLLYSTFTFPKKSRQWQGVFLRILRKLATELIPELEFADAKASLIDDLEAATETPGDLAEFIFTSVRRTNRVPMFEEVKAEIRAVTREDVLAASQAIICPERLYATFVGPLPSEKDQRAIFRALKNWKLK